MISPLRGPNSVRSCVATASRSFASCGLVCNNAALLCSITPRTIGSNIWFAPFAWTRSRPSATAAALGCWASAAPANNWHASTIGASRRRDLAFMIDPSCFVSRPLDDTPAFRPGDHGRMGEPDEKPVFNHPRNTRQPLGKRAGISDPLQGSVENEMAAVRDENMAGFVAPERDRPG